jgi:heterodisulfide reductase subunit A-like polyferredoxin
LDPGSRATDEAKSNLRSLVDRLDALMQLREQLQRISQNIMTAGGGA